MKRLVEFPLEGGGSVLVEVDEPGAEAGTVRVARPGEIAEKARASFEEAVGQVRPAAESIIAKLRDLSDPPDQIEVEFGLKLSAQAGAFIAAAGVEGTYRGKMTWKRSERSHG